MTAISGFPRSRRLTKTDEFSSVFVFKCSVRGQYLHLMARPNQLGYSRLGAVVGKKAARHATDRNYMKRVIRELYRRTDRPIMGLDIIIRVQTPFRRKDFEMVREELEILFAKAERCLTR